MGAGGGRSAASSAAARASPNGPSSAAGARGEGRRRRGRPAHRARAAGAPHKARGAGATAAPPPRERLGAGGCPRADSGGRPQAFVCWFRAAFLAGWLPVTEVIHSFQNCLGARAGAEPARGCSPAPRLPPRGRFSPSARPSPKVPPGRDAGRGPARPFPAAQVASGREGAFDLQLGPSGLVQLAAAGREERRRRGWGGHFRTERAAARTSLRRERRLVAPREGVITAPGLIPAEVPGVTFPSSRAVVSVASGGGAGGRTARAGGGGAAGLAHPGGRREQRGVLRAGRRPGSPARVALPGSRASPPAPRTRPSSHATPPPPRALRRSPVAPQPPGPRLSHLGLPLPGARGRPQPRRPGNAASKQKKRAI